MRKPTQKTLAIDKTQQKTMLKIGDVAKLSGLAIETLRFYEKSGLLDKPARTFSGYRLYAKEVLERLSFIKQAQTIGFSLDEIHRIINDAHSGQIPCGEVREIVRQRLVELEEHISKLVHYQKVMTNTLEEWDRIGQVPGHVCGLIESLNIEPSLKIDKKLGQKSKMKQRTQK
jgi:DNA-binding transcriptional MerR regulator